MKLRFLLATAVLVAGTTTVGAPTALADPPPENQCFNIAGVDLNDLFDIDDQIVARLCNETSVGEHWVPLTLWIVAGSDAVYPAGYAPAAPTPIEDLVHKLSAVRIVIDGGTRTEHTLTVDAAGAVRADLTLDRFDPESPPLPTAFVLPRLRPLAPGEHTYEVIWVLDAMHCDGIAASVEENCLPAGATSFLGPRPFTVST